MEPMDIGAQWHHYTNPATVSLNPDVVVSEWYRYTHFIICLSSSPPYRPFPIKTPIHLIKKHANKPVIHDYDEENFAFSNLMFSGVFVE